MKDGSAIGSGILVYKLIDKYWDPLPQFAMPWKAQVPQVELSNTVGFVDFLVSALAYRYGGLREGWKNWVLEHGIAAGISALIGLAMTPALYVISGPPYIPGVTSPAVTPTVYPSRPVSEARVEVSGAF